MKLSVRTMKSAGNCSSRSFSVVAENEAATTLTTPTTASPIISAAAVRAVRRGSRMAFSRPSLPGTPSLDIGPPITRASGRAITCATMAAPMNAITAPTPSTTNSVWVSGIQRAPKNIPNPTTATAAARPTRPRAPPAGAGASSRKAAIGEMEAALRAGRMAATRVTPTPTTIATTHVRGRNWSDVLGSSTPISGEDPLEAGGDGEPEEQPRQGREHADHQRLRHDHPDDLTAAWPRPRAGARAGGSAGRR